MKLARVIGVPFALIKDLTDGQDISFRTLALLKATDMKRKKKRQTKRKRIIRAKLQIIVK